MRCSSRVGYTHYQSELLLDMDGIDSDCVQATRVCRVETWDCGCEFGYDRGEGVSSCM